MFKQSLFLRVGALCALMSWAASANMLYVTDVDASTLAAVDSTGAIAWQVNGLSSPNGVLERGGMVYVASSDSIQRYSSSDGTFDNTWSISFAGVSGIAMDLAGNIFAISSAELRKYSGGGGAPVATATGLDTPTAVAVNDAGDVFVAQHVACVDECSEIRRYSWDLALSAQFIDMGGAVAGGLVTRGDDLFVSDLLNAKVDRYDTTGGNNPTAILVTDTDLSFPWGLAIDPSTGNIAVASSGAGSIQILDAAGDPLSPLSFVGNPAGLAFSSVPEPGTYAIIGIGLLMLSFVGRRKR